MSWSLAKALAPSLFTALLAVDGRAPWAALVLTSAVAAALLLRVERHLPADAVRPVAETVVRTAPAETVGRTAAGAVGSRTAPAETTDRTTAAP
jgi:hypothetical protein